jgi:hypothetical protein
VGHSGGGWWMMGLSGRCCWFWGLSMTSDPGDHQGHQPTSAHAALNSRATGGQRNDCATQLAYRNDCDKPKAETPGYTFGSLGNATATLLEEPKGYIGGAVVIKSCQPSQRTTSAARVAIRLHPRRAHPASA